MIKKCIICNKEYEVYDSKVGNIKGGTRKMKLKRFKEKLSWHDFIMLMYTHCLDAQKKGDFDIIQL